jgi:hypothetical protein
VLLVLTITDTIIIPIITNAFITIAIITISPECAHIRPQSVGSQQWVPLDNLSRRSALPKIQLFTFHAESQAKNVNTMTMKLREI